MISWLPQLLLTLAVVGLVVFALMTLTGNFATKQFFDRLGVGLRGRYVAAVSLLAVGVALCLNSTLGA